MELITEVQKLQLNLEEYARNGPQDLHMHQSWYIHSVRLDCKQAHILNTPHSCQWFPLSESSPKFCS